MEFEKDFPKAFSKTFGISLPGQSSWEIDENGNLFHKGIPEYLIEQDSSGIDWLSHLSEKSWFKVDEFLPVYNYWKRQIIENKKEA